MLLNRIFLKFLSFFNLDILSAHLSFGGKIKLKYESWNIGKKNHWLKSFMMLISIIDKHTEVAVHTFETT